MRKLIVFTILIIFMFSGLIAQSEDHVLSQKVDSLEKVIKQLDDENIANQKEVSRLKKEKNERIESIRKKEQKIVLLALVITVLSILLIIFFFAYRSVRRRKRLDVAELEEEIRKLKS